VGPRRACDVFQTARGHFLAQSGRDLFARLEREVIARGIFTLVQDLSRKLMRYIGAYSKTARPIKWKYSDVRRRILFHANELMRTATSLVRV